MLSVVQKNKKRALSTGTCISIFYKVWQQKWVFYKAGAV